jgi:hypothetical protein
VPADLHGTPPALDGGMHTIIALMLIAQADTSARIHAGPELDTPRDNSILSARGPLTGSGAVSFATSFIGPIPLIDFRWLHGASDLVQTELQIRTLGILSLVELGARFRLVEGEYFSLALRTGGHAAAAFLPGEDGDDDFAGFAGGLGGAVLLSFGPEWMQWTATFEGRGTVNHEGDIFPGTKASIGVEFPLGPQLNAFFEGALLTNFVDGEVRQIPVVTHGLAF